MGRLIRWLIVFPLLGLLLYVGHPFLLRAMGRYLITEDRLQKAEAIVVLAGDGGVARTLEAVRLYQDGYAPRIILTHQRLPKGYEALARLGITVPEERDVQWMILKAMRIPANVVLQVNERADSTESEMAYLARLLKQHRIGTVILVTDRSHSTRANKILVRVSGGKVAIISRPTRYDTFDPEGWWRSRADAKEVLMEYEKLFNYLLQSMGVGVTGWLKDESHPAVPVEATF
ncbi:YdcF family protein [Candidatus Methylomirabilis sp.]|uniref:YdcF family protein n=1 Tax=Candidatus Methylomirabilis tolerans TaxID=3123416 RepID=A0AAJ1AKJ5_9BACT|nr:YdcF family protein [Candidatus Methylomirabilis sp.]